MRRTVLALAFLGVLNTASSAHAQPTVRTLSTPEDIDISFDKMVAQHVRRTVGGRLPSMDEGEPLLSSVLVTVGARHVWVWDRPVLDLPQGSFPAAALASCPGPCSPTLRDAAGFAILEHAAWLREKQAEHEPSFLVVVDTEVSFETVLIALRSLAYATAGAPAPMRLLANTPSGMRAVPVYIMPPDPIPIRPVTNPLLLEIEMSSQTWIARARPYYLKAPVKFVDTQTFLNAIGEVRARDTNRKVVFLSVPRNTAMRVATRAIDLVRQLYPMVVLKLPGPIATRVTERPR